MNILTLLENLIVELESQGWEFNYKVATEENTVILSVEDSKDIFISQNRDSYTVANAYFEDEVKQDQLKAFLHGFIYCACMFYNSDSPLPARSQ